MTNSKQSTVLVLGANGRFGRNAANAFAQAGWNVLAHTRPSKNLTDDVSGTHLPFDIENAAQFEAAAQKCSVLVNALHPEYPYWAEELPKISRTTIAAAKASGATLMFPGNVYNFGTAMPSLLTEDTPHVAQTKKGKLRIVMENEYREASKQGVQTIILRCGDFLERKKTGSWFDTHLTGRLRKGTFTYPGEHNLPHAWAYLPDAGRALVELAEIRETLNVFEDIPFEGTTLTAREIAFEIAKTLGQDMKISNIPWLAIKFMGLFNPTMREVLEMRYLWDVDHKLDGTKMARLLPDFERTPISEIMKDILADHMN